MNSCCLLFCCIALGPGSARAGGAEPVAGGADAGARAGRAKFDLEERRREHWAWRAVREVKPPASVEGSPTHPVDRFILAALAERGLVPSPPAERQVLIRRAYQDLIGLPPRPEEIESFLHDESPDAFDRLLDRLLVSPHFGERWARHWLDLVRYAETQGHEFDYAIHEAWRYRDYLIRAFNADLPYDRFITEQIAGDLVAEPRLHPTEGTNESILGPMFFRLGQESHSPVDVRQQQAERIENQVDVLTKSFLGLTVACARCHDHKFDAISTRDYYAFYGILESSRAALAPIEPAARGKEIALRLAALRKELREAVGNEWLRGAEETGRRLADRIAGGEAAAAGGAGTPGAAAGGGPVTARFARQDSEGSEVIFADFRAGFGGWLAEGPAFALGPERAGEILLGTPERPVREILGSGWAHSGALSKRFWGVLRSPDFTIERRLIHVFAAGRSSRINVVIDGYTMIRDPIYGGLKKSLDHDRPRWITFDVNMWRGHRAYLELADVPAPDPTEGKGYGPDGWLAVNRVLFSDGGPPAAGEPADPQAALALNGGGRERCVRAVVEVVEAWRSGQLADSPAGVSQAALLGWLLEEGLLGAGRAGDGESRPGPVPALLGKYAEIERSIAEPVTVAGMTDGSGVDERVFVRGDHRELGEAVNRRFLEAIDGPLPLEIPRGSGRRELARRIADPSNPLTARVLVNRVWQRLFGRGLVASVDNFGKLGRLPTHPDLLDYLAGWFVKEGWSQKKLIRFLMTSKAYQRSSRPARAEDEERDPLNEYLHRMPVRRLEAEAIRDAILAVSGSLDRKLFGPPVPVHLTPFMDGRGRPDRSGPLDGAGRRSLYLEVRRNFLPPMLLAFDAPIPFTTVGDRSSSNVPAQSLILMNDPFVIGEAGRWAARIIANGDRPPRERIALLYLAALGRPPLENEVADWLAFLDRQGEEYGLAPAERLSSTRTWTDLCHVVFNLKEFIFIE